MVNQDFQFKTEKRLLQEIRESIDHVNENVKRVLEFLEKQKVT